ncbi:MAG: hypothetical protein IKM43_00705 [Clostridia bacterium]|nr:hypothetical protein [Clostridia bacterium]
MKYFGTDGIRGLAVKDLNEKLLKKVANAIVKTYNKNKWNKILLVGNDTRLSSYYILSVLESVLLKHGINVETVDNCSSPCLAYLTQKFNYPLGLMLSASHNPSEFNGLKFFNNLGEKVSDEFEEEFENLMQKPLKTKLKFATHKNKEHLKQYYITHLKSLIKNKLPVIIDCSNGGASEICNAVFANAIKINNKPNGTNINQNAGCTHISFLRSLCIKQKKLGISVDGDADRIHLVSPKGNIFSGDKILYILSKFFQKSNDVLVGTIYTNSGLEKSLNKNKIKLKRAQVGDKKVSAMMKEFSSSLGGEDSGHIILKNRANTGDGLLIAIMVCNILELTNSTLEELTKDYQEHCQLRANFKLAKQFVMTKEIEDTIQKATQKDCKVIIRPSGTEPVLRLFVENKNKEIAQIFLKKLENLIKNQ